MNLRFPLKSRESRCELLKLRGGEFGDWSTQGTWAPHGADMRGLGRVVAWGPHGDQKNTGVFTNREKSG